MKIRYYQETNMNFTSKKGEEGLDYSQVKGFEEAYQEWFITNKILDKYPWFNLEFNNNEKKEISKMLSKMEFVSGLNLAIEFNNFFKTSLSIEENLENFYWQGWALYVLC